MIARILILWQESHPALFLKGIMIKLIICETVESVWNYHLRQVEQGHEKYMGVHDGYALCGTKIGWDTEIPLACYNESGSHIPEHWCKKCLKIARDSKMPGVDQINE